MYKNANKLPKYEFNSLTLKLIIKGPKGPRSQFTVLLATVFFVYSFLEIILITCEELDLI